MRFLGALYCGIAGKRVPIDTPYGEDVKCPCCGLVVLGRGR